MKNKYFYPIFKLKTKSWIRYWLIKKTEFKGKLSEILTGFSFNLENTLNRKFNLFEIEGNSTQETTTGKNLLPYPYTAETKTMNGVTFKVNEDGTVTANGTATANAYFMLKGDIDLNGTYTISTGLGISDTKYMALLDQNDGYADKMTTRINNATATVNSRFQAYIYVTSGTTVNNVLFKPMIRLATITDDTYEPYTGGIASPNPNYEQPILSSGDNGSITEKITNADGTQEQTYTIPVQQPMRSIGDVRDCFIKENGTWYERHIITQIGLDGTENWSRNDAPGFIRYVITLANMKSVGSVRSTDILCNIFKPSTENEYNNCFAFNNTVAFYVPENIENFGEFSELLQEKNAKLQYELAEPLDLQCTETQIQQLENLPSSYAGQTNIYSEDETPAYLRIQYWESDENG